MMKQIVQLLGIVFLVYLTIRVDTGNEPYLLGAINLIFHEAGHWVFAFFGQFIAVLGGTLMQLLVPFILGIYFLIRKEIYSASVLMWWLGENMIGVAIYIGDATRQALPLLGGEAVMHDWYYLLGQLDLLNQDILLSNIVHALGMGIMTVALLIALVVTIPALTGKALEYLQT